MQLNQFTVLMKPLKMTEIVMFSNYCWHFSACNWVMFVAFLWKNLQTVLSILSLLSSNSTVLYYLHSFSSM